MSERNSAASGQDMYISLQEKMERAEESLNALPIRGRQLAKAEEAYRIALAKRLLIRREEGLPATLAGDIVRGEPDIAALKRQRDELEALYDATEKSIDLFKLYARILDSQITREWGRKD